MGATLRYAVNVSPLSRSVSGFPWHTLAVNIVGAFLVGILVALVSEKHLLPAHYGLLLGTGVLGGFTTFSTFAFETVALAEQGRLVLGLANVIVSTVLGVGAAALGLFAGRAL